MALLREQTAEEEEVMEVEPRTPNPAPSCGSGVRDDNSPIQSSTPGSGAELTQRDLQRVRRRFVSVSEHLRDSIAETREALNQTRTEVWEAIEDVGQERVQVAPAFQRLLDTRTEMLVGAFEAGLRALRNELDDFVTPLQNRVDILQSTVERVADSTQKAVEELNHNAAEAVAAATARASQEGSDWSLVDDEDFQELRGRVDVLEEGAPSGPSFGINETQYDLHRALEDRVSEIESVLRQRSDTHQAAPSPGPANKSILDFKFI
ncbi:hypothetical protein N9L19_01020 [bacterium]|nr:hypothetical protein [bacterium]